ALAERRHRAGRHRRDRYEAEAGLGLHQGDPLIQPPPHFTPGDIVRWRRVGGLVLAEVQFEAGQRIHREQHPHARFVLVLKGSLTETGPAAAGHDDRTGREFGPSTLLFRSADEPRSYAASDRGATCLVVDMDSAWLARARQQAPVLARSGAFRRGL